LICASDVGALLGDPRVPHQPNEAVAADYLLDSHRGRAGTLFKHIMRLEPAHYMVVDAAGVKLRRYYDLPPGAELRYRSDDDYAAHFSALFKDAVRARLRSAGAVGAYLSGGLDSSSIVAMAQALYREGAAPRIRFETYSMILPPPADEREFIDAMVSRWELSSNRPPPLTPSLPFLIDQVHRFHGLPEYPNAALAFPIRQLAHEQGVRVMLDGRGGDEWLQGTRAHLADLITRLRLVALVKRLRVQIEQARIYGFPFSPWRELLGNGIKPLLPPALIAALRRALGREHPKPPWIDAGLLRRAGLHKDDQRDRTRSFAQRELYETFADPYLAIVHECEERSAAWAGFEVRTPFNDRRLVEFCCALPEDQRRATRIKVVLRNAMRGLLPESVRERTGKAEFSACFFEALRAPGIAELFEQSRLAEVGWIDPRSLIEHYNETLRSYAVDNITYGPAGNTQHLWRLWNAVGLELWLRSEF